MPFSFSIYFWCYLEDTPFLGVTCMLCHITCHWGNPIGRFQTRSLFTFCSSSELSGFLHFHCENRIRAKGNASLWGKRTGKLIYNFLSLTGTVLTPLYKPTTGSCTAEPPLLRVTWNPPSFYHLPGFSLPDRIRDLPVWVASSEKPWTSCISCSVFSVGLAFHLLQQGLSLCFHLLSLRWRSSSECLLRFLILCRECHCSVSLLVSNVSSPSPSFSAEIYVSR